MASVGDGSEVREGLPCQAVVRELDEGLRAPAEVTGPWNSYCRHRSCVAGAEVGARIQCRRTVEGTVS